jgi:hypothetical protein
MNTKLSVCGCDCAGCDYLKKSQCAGCSAIEGKVWWVGYVGAEVCPIYECVVKRKKLEHCGKCSEIPCRLWQELKDPSYTDAEHEAGIRERVEKLKKLL